MKRQPDPKRGRHKRATSPETRRWNREHRPPPRPSWASDDTYAALIECRKLVEELHGR